MNATGGTITYSNGKKIHTFTSETDTFVVTESGELTDVLVIGSGGGGGLSPNGIDFGGAGGGAGGYRKFTNISVLTGSYSIIVGQASLVNSSGSFSNFLYPTSGSTTYKSDGGGKGANGDISGGDGGSGGGQFAYSVQSGSTPGYGNIGSYSPSEGYDGGHCSQWDVSSGGGGGYTAVGGDGTVTRPSEAVFYGTSGNGGDGIYEELINSYCCGGGGGGAVNRLTETTIIASAGDNGLGGGSSFYGGGGSGTQRSGAGVIVIQYNAPIPDAPTNFSASKNLSDEVTITWTGSDGATGYKIYRNSSHIATLSNIETYSDSTASQPLITPGSSSASNNYVDHVSLSLSGQSISNGTTYTYYVTAFNNSGESISSTTDNGYRSASTLNYQWQVSENNTDANYSNISGATTSSYNYTDAPLDGSIRYYRCVLSSIDSITKYSTSISGNIEINRYWIGGTGNWTDITHWSTSNNMNNVFSLDFEGTYNDSINSTAPTTNQYTSLDTSIFYHGLSSLKLPNGGYAKVIYPITGLIVGDFKLSYYLQIDTVNIGPGSCAYFQLGGVSAYSYYPNIQIYPQNGLKIYISDKTGTYVGGGTYPAISINTFYKIGISVTGRVLTFTLNDVVLDTYTATIDNPFNEFTYLQINNNSTTENSWVDFLSIDCNIGGAPSPTQYNKVYFNENSFSRTGQIVTADSAQAKSIDFTGSLYSPTLSFSSSIAIYGDITLSSNLIIDDLTSQGFTLFRSCNLTSNENTGIIYIGAWDSSSVLSLQDNLTVVVIDTCSINTNGYNLNIKNFDGDGGTNLITRIMILDGSTINLIGSSPFFGLYGNCSISGNNTTINIPSDATIEIDNSDDIMYNNLISGNYENKCIININPSATINTVFNTTFNNVTVTGIILDAFYSNGNVDAGGNTGINFGQEIFGSIIFF